ncbi:hypothetical protein [Streptomyces jumonjinensis]|uniref:Uncharacterized protein n=1 Tax=Streptomyces jumonjinensis TaxID=1945 RepID=A0A646KRE5_STRJU|nr:hypothetical protein [Streptomyces jumonjinensis]MQT03576.1 hypothetical protein [Streptomyces jumonjinensis]
MPEPITPLSRQDQRSIFVWFLGILAFLYLMQATLTSEAADELIEDASNVTGFAMMTMLAAGTLWDRLHPPSEQDQETTPESGN